MNTFFKSIGSMLASIITILMSIVTRLISELFRVTSLRQQIFLGKLTFVTIYF